MKDKQTVFKEKKILVNMESITLVYQFLNGNIMGREIYDKEFWKDSNYTFEDYYEATFEGDNYFIKAQTKIVNTLKEAKKFQNKQIQKLINRKKREIKKLKEQMDKIKQYEKE